MCRPTRCKQCGKTTWAGCGNHVEQVKASVPSDEWCDGQHERSQSSTSSGGFFKRLIRR